MELFLVLAVALVLLKPSDVQHLAACLGRLLALKRKSQKQMKQLLDDMLQHSAQQKNTQHDTNT